MADSPALLRLTRLRVKNFRSIRELDIPLGPLTVLVGPNGSGKSNVLDALRFMRDCLMRGVDQAVLARQGFDNLRHWTPQGGADEVSFGVTYLDISNATVAYDFVLTAGGKAGHQVQQQEELHFQATGQPGVHFFKQEKTLQLTWGDHLYGGEDLYPRWATGKATLWGPRQMASYADHLLREKLDEEKPLDPFSLPPAAYVPALMLERLLLGALVYTLAPRDLRAPQPNAHAVYFEEEGANLGAVLKDLIRDPYSWETIRLVLQRLVMGVTDLSVESLGSYLVTHLHYDTGNGLPRRADLGQESDGTLRALAIMAALFQPDDKDPTLGAVGPHDLLAFEEPELHIHPGMLAVLAELFVSESQRRQIVLTTHSPELLDYLPLDSFLIVEKVDGETRIGPLAADQIETARRELFTPGELLRSEGLHREEASASPSPAAE